MDDAQRCGSNEGCEFGKSRFGKENQHHVSASRLPHVCMILCMCYRGFGGGFGLEVPVVSYAPRPMLVATASLVIMKLTVL